MDPHLEKLREVQKEAWNKSSAGWKKWDEIMMTFLSPMTVEIIHMLCLRDDDIVMDAATGTGEPGLTIASMLKLGKVTGTDLAEGMLAVAAENAARRGIYNFETACCDISALPFQNDTFSAVSCRLGFNLFPDMQLALTEMLRVLKPGGRIAASVWGNPEKNPWIAVNMETMISMLQLKPPTPGAPGAFRCAQPGLMTDLFKQSGLRNISEKEVVGKFKCDTLETYWNFITETSSPVVYSNANEALKQQIKNEVLGKVTQKLSGGHISLDSCAIVIYGEK